MRLLEITETLKRGSISIALMCLLISDVNWLVSDVFLFLFYSCKKSVVMCHADLTEEKCIKRTAAWTANCLLR